MPINNTKNQVDKIKIENIPFTRRWGVFNQILVFFAAANIPAFEGHRYLTYRMIPQNIVFI